MWRLPLMIKVFDGVRVFRIVSDFSRCIVKGEVVSHFKLIDELSSKQKPQNIYCTRSRKISFTSSFSSSPTTVCWVSMSALETHLSFPSTIN